MTAKIEMSQNGGWVHISADGTKKELFDIDQEINRNAWMWHRSVQGGFDEIMGNWLITGKIDKSGGDYGISNLLYYLKKFGDVTIQ